MWWLALPFALFAAASKAAQRVVLRAGETWRYVASLEAPDADPETLSRAVVQGLHDAGARDVLVMPGPPLVCMWTQLVKTTRVLKLGEPQPYTLGGVHFRITFLEAERWS